MVISDAEMEVAFQGTNFGSTNYRQIVEQGILKRLCGFYNGGTLTQILMHFNLVDKDNSPTDSGRLFAYRAFRESH